MTRVCDIFNYSPAPRYEKAEELLFNDLGIGIEIEAENAGTTFHNKFAHNEEAGAYWQLKPDHSLRNNGIEFCSRILFGVDIPRALNSIHPYLETLTLNWRTGIHIHTDIRDRTVNDLIRIFELYSILEPIIFAWEGNQRDLNNFCVPWRSCNTPLMVFSEAVNKIREGEMSRDYQRHYLNNLQGIGKYSALNIIPLTSFGSLEFRHMQATDNINKILTFVNICSSIVRNGPELDLPAGELLSRVGEEEFINVTTGIPDLLQMPDYPRLLWEGVGTFNLIPTLLTDMKLSELANPTDFPII